MRRKLALSISVLFFAALPASAQKILPTSIAGWSQDAGAATTALASAPPGVMAEYGSKSTEVAVYGGPSSRNLRVLLYQMKDASGAYGLYSFLRTPDMRRANFTDHSSISSDRALVLAGNLVLDVNGRELAGSSAQIKALVAAISPQAEEGSLPNLPFYLPEDRRVDVTDRYILGPQTLDQLFPEGLERELDFSAARKPNSPITA